MPALLAGLTVAGSRLAAAQPVEAHSLSLHPERLLPASQQWGVLGLNVAAHEAHKAGEPLRIGTQTYTHGLGQHAAGKIEVLLLGEFDRFEAEVGLQPCAGGSVVFRVAADGQVLFDSGVMRSGDAPKAVSVPVADAGVLTLEALDAGDGITCDMANWANARLTPPPRRARPPPGGPWTSPGSARL